MSDRRSSRRDLIAAEATKWIESRGDSPFFLYVPFTAVHLPVKEPAEWVARVPATITGEVARHYVQATNWAGPWRIDVVAVQMDGNGRLLAVEHIRHAVRDE